ncbi:MAG: hypothetical protein K6A67_05130 [Bacteroidales bacterium]|nr:hypothetical protein [Bacteroidales bacterium]
MSKNDIEQYINTIQCCDCLEKRNMELTKQQIERQDFVDNAIFELINKLIPSDKKMEWDIEAIGEIRDAIQAYFVGRGFCTGKEFYPYIQK